MRPHASSDDAKLLKESSGVLARHGILLLAPFFMEASEFLIDEVGVQV